MGLAYGACDDKDARSAKRITYVIDAGGRVEQAHAKVDAKTHPATLLDTLASAPEGARRGG